MEIYTHPQLPTVWIVKDNDGWFWMVFAQANGWEQRKWFCGDTSRLEKHNLPVLGIGLPR